MDGALAKFSEEELSVIETVFNSCDYDKVGRIHINQITGFLSKLGKSDDDMVRITEAASKIADDNDGQLSLEDMINVLAKTDKISSELPDEGADPKVLEFLRILEEYRVKCEDEGNYLEAARAYRQLGVLRKQVEKRQQKAIQARQISEKQDVQLAHNMQFAEFNKSWDKYMEDYDNMAQVYIQQMTERHAVVLLEFQKELREELASKPPKWSRALLDQRRKQHINARNKNYSMAQKLKKQSDRTEEKERRELEQAQAVVFGRREAKFRQQQQTELQALLKRIECRRKEHVKQRSLDTKRLLQRNRNVMAVLESKQAAECQKLFAEIKKLLYSNAVLTGGASSTGRHSGTREGFGTNSHATTKRSSMAQSGTTRSTSQTPGRSGGGASTYNPGTTNSGMGTSGTSGSKHHYSDDRHGPSFAADAKGGEGIDDMPPPSPAHSAAPGYDVYPQYHPQGAKEGDRDADEEDDDIRGDNELREKFRTEPAPDFPDFIGDTGPKFSSLVYEGNYEDDAEDESVEGVGGGGSGARDEAMAKEAKAEPIGM